MVRPRRRRVVRRRNGRQITIRAARRAWRRRRLSIGALPRLPLRELAVGQDIMATAVVEVAPTDPLSSINLLPRTTAAAPAAAAAAAPQGLPQATMAEAVAAVAGRIISTMMPRPCPTSSGRAAAPGRRTVEPPATTEDEKTRARLAGRSTDSLSPT